MSGYWSRGIADLETYVPGEQPRNAEYVKLNTNENPYPPSPRVLDAIKNAVDERLHERAGDGILIRTGSSTAVW